MAFEGCYDLYNASSVYNPTSFASQTEMTMCCYKNIKTLPYISLSERESSSQCFINLIAILLYELLWNFE